MVEHETLNFCAVGSIPTQATNKKWESMTPILFLYIMSTLTEVDLSTGLVDSTLSHQKGDYV